MSKKRKRKVKNEEQDYQWKVIIPQKVYDTIFHIAKCAEPDEVQMLGEVSYENGIFRLHTVHLIDQVVGIASASFNSTALAKFVSAHPNPALLRGWVHSHVRMGTFWSGTDDGTIERFVRRGWCLSIVVSIEEDHLKMLARVDLNFEPVHQALDLLTKNHDLIPGLEILDMLPLRATWDSVPIEIEGLLTDEEKTFWKEQVSDKLDGEAVDSKKSEGKIIYKYKIDNEEVIVDSHRRCEYCIYDTPSELCDKGIDRGPKKTTVGCKSFYPAYFRGTS